MHPLNIYSNICKRSENTDKFYINSRECGGHFGTEPVMSMNKNNNVNLLCEFNMNKLGDIIIMASQITTNLIVFIQKLFHVNKRASIKPGLCFHLFVKIQ